MHACNCCSQEGVGAASSLRELGNLGAYEDTGGFYPVTCETLHLQANLISFGLSTSSIEPRVNGLNPDDGNSNAAKSHPVSESDEISFLLELTPDKRRGFVRVFRNLELLSTFTDVDTSFKFVRNPKLPRVLIS
ncbi:hypothetical protein Pelo_19409 [Pelomyxa schiedti]|nr:hypothetical protein Pelo_19409 [Pelomyxa schiedti]